MSNNSGSDSSVFEVDNDNLLDMVDLYFEDPDELPQNYKLILENGMFLMFHL